MITELLLKTGLLQFGLFVEDGQKHSYRLHLEMLAAYPQLMQQLVYKAVQRLGAQNFDRLVAHADCIPLSAALALHTGIPLVYSRGRGESPVYDLVGAYDVGHPAILLVNTIDSSVEQLSAKCHSVGLEVHTILELVTTGKTIAGVEQIAVMSMGEILHEIRLKQLIPNEQIETVLSSL